MSFYKGICYLPFPAPYNPSMANTTCIFYGSDIAYDPMAPLWGKSYQSSKGSSCGSASGATCRNDLQTLKDMGVNLLRLYSWDPRNHHLNFLDYCQGRNRGQARRKFGGLVAWFGFVFGRGFGGCCRGH